MQSKTYKPGWRDRTQEKHKAHKVTQRANRLKIGLAILAGFTIAIITLWPSLKTIPNNALSQQIEQKMKRNPNIKNTVYSPKLESLDKKGRPFTVIAKYAFRIDPNNTDFDQPEGEMKLDDESTFTFKASRGHYHKGKNTLELKGNVHLTTDKGYDLYTQSAEIDLISNQGEGNAPIKGTGPSGEQIQAEGFQITDKGDNIKFKGKTSMSFPTK